MQLERRIEEDMRPMMGLFQTFIDSPQILTRISIVFIDLVDATGQKHPAPMNMASSLEVRLYVSPEIILIIIFSNSMTLFEHYFNQAVFKARYYDDT